MRRERGGDGAPRCASCTTRNCRNGADCFGQSARHLAFYKDERIARMHRAAATVEGRYYCKATRLAEVALFGKEMGFHKLGLAFCIGLADEAKVIADVLSRDFTVVSTCCKTCGVAKRRLGLRQIRPRQKHETMCNPAGQADFLNRAGTELNVICGLCVGHDCIFSMRSKAPVTTLIAKDRVLGHNPIAAVYCQYVRRRV